MNVSELVRPHLRQLKPYSSARDEFQGSAAIMLDANENALGSVVGDDLHRYPDPHQRELKSLVARHRDVAPESIFVGNGSDEAIDLLFRTFCAPQSDYVITLPPTYGMYSVSASIHNVRVEEVPLRADFSVAVDEVVARFSPQSKLLFLCSPNNPSGNIIPHEVIETLASQFPGIVVVDEAYIDFAPQASALGALKTHQNVVVLQTLSKAWGLAGLRVGFAFAHPATIEVFDRIKAPYNVSEMSLRLAQEALGNIERKDEMVRTLLTERARMNVELANTPCVSRVYPSDANFLLIQVSDAPGIYRTLVEQGIVVRDRSGIVGCENCLRITIGTTQENDVLLKALEEIA